jgi:hypothetical protein
MNPALINAAASIRSAQIANKNKPSAATKYDMQLELLRLKRQRRTRAIVGYTVAGLAVIIAGKRIIKTIKNKQAESDTSVEAQLAKQFHLAMQPWQWGAWAPDGKDINKIYSAAYRIANEDLSFKKVSRKYNSVTGRDLNEDLRKELSGEEYARLQSILSENYDPTGDPENPKNPGYFRTTDSGEFYPNPGDTFGIGYEPALWIDTYLTGRKVPHTRLYVKIGDLLEVKSAGGKLYYVKEDRGERLSPARYNELLKAPAVKKLRLGKKS